MRNAERGMRISGSRTSWIGSRSKLVLHFKTLDFGL